MGDGLILGAANELLNLGVPLKLIVNDCVSEGKEARKGVRGDGIFRRKRAGGMSTRPLISEDPEVKF